MIDSWLRPIEQIMLAAIESEARVLGVVSPDDGAGVSTVCSMLAESHFRSGVKTLLIDFTQTIDLEDRNMSWVPGDGAAQLIQTHEKGFDVLATRPTARSRPLFNNVEALREMLQNQLASYKAIIIDLPPVLHQRNDLINPLATARACDTVIMVCMVGKIKRQRVEEARSVLETAGIQLGGVVLNELHSPTLAVEMASRVRRLSLYAPKISNWIERKLLSSQFLNHK